MGFWNGLRPAEEQKCSQLCVEFHQVLWDGLLWTQVKTFLWWCPPYGRSFSTPGYLIGQISWKIYFYLNEFYLVNELKLTGLTKVILCDVTCLVFGFVHAALILFLVQILRVSITFSFSPVRIVLLKTKGVFIFWMLSRVRAKGLFPQTLVPVISGSSPLMMMPWWKSVYVTHPKIYRGSHTLERICFLLFLSSLCESFICFFIL